MTDYNISDIAEILVVLSSGKQFIYRDKGILSLRRTLNNGSIHPQNDITIVDGSGEDDGNGGDEEEEEPQFKKPIRRTEKSQGKQESPKGARHGTTGRPTEHPRPQTANGYSMIPLKYTAAKNAGSPMDIARDLQRQAEEASGVKY